MSYLAYVHARPNTEDASGIFYVGKGRLARAKSLEGRNRHHANVVAKYGSENILVGTFECSSEQTAFDLEVGLIKCLRRMGVSLTNQTDGGEGTSGYHHDDTTKSRMSTAVRAGLTEEVVASRALAIKQALNIPEVHAKRVLAIKEAWADPLLRGTQSSLAAGLWADEEYRTTQISSRVKSWQDPETRRLRSDAVKKAKSTPEARRKVSVAMKQVYQDPVMRLQASARTKGKVWANNGVKNIRVFPVEVPEGFVLGRLPHKST